MQGSPSTDNMDQILNNIKQVITNGELPADDVLVLTEAAEEEIDVPLPEIAPAEAQSENVDVAIEPIVNKTDDLLAEIDAGVTPPTADLVDVAAAPSIEKIEEVTTSLEPAKTKRAEPTIALDDIEMPTQQSEKLIDSSEIKWPTEQEIKPEAVAPKLDQNLPTGGGMQEESLVKDSIANSIRSAVENALSPNQPTNNNTLDSGLTMLSSKTMEDVVVTILRKELKAWLDQNLEEMVRNIISTEIKRILQK